MAPQSWLISAFLQETVWNSCPETGPVSTASGSGQYSIRVNRQWRICFNWTTGGVEDVELTDYH